MPTLLFQVITVVFNLVIIVFVVFYLLSLRTKEKEIDRKIHKIDTDYDQVVGHSSTQQHQIVEGALNQSNQIMTVATHQANQILAGAQYLSQTTKATLDASLQQMVVTVQGVGANSKISLETALQKIITDVHKEAFDTGLTVTESYKASLKQVTDNSLSGFQNVTQELELDLQMQIKNFRQEVLANIEKEVETYKAAKIRRIDQASVVLVERVAQQVLNKSLTIEDHENLVLKSLDKAKKEGVFD